MVDALWKLFLLANVWLALWLAVRNYRRRNDTMLSFNLACVVLWGALIVEATLQ